MCPSYFTYLLTIWLLSEAWIPLRGTLDCNRLVLASSALSSCQLFQILARVA